MRKVRLFDGFNHDDDNSLSHSFSCEGESLTVQSQKEEADINTIVRRFGLTGQVAGVEMPPPIEHFVSVTDYRSALDAIRAADASFMELSAEVRKRFDNDPAAFVEFCSRKENVDELRKMGLAVPAPASAPGLAASAGGAGPSGALEPGAAPGGGPPAPGSAS